MSSIKVCEIGDDIYIKLNKDDDVMLLSKTKYDRFMALERVVRAMKRHAIAEEEWYTFLPCEFAEDVDMALDELETK